jgi:hypothetical protein
VLKISQHTVLLAVIARTLSCSTPTASASHLQRICQLIKVNAQLIIFAHTNMHSNIAAGSPASSPEASLNFSLSPSSHLQRVCQLIKGNAQLIAGMCTWLFLYVPAMDFMRRTTASQHAPAHTTVCWYIQRLPVTPKWGSHTWLSAA